MVSVANRDQAWQLLFDANRYVRYWSMIHQRMLNRSRWQTLILAGLATGAGTALIADLPPWIAILANAGVVMFSVMTLIRDTAGRIAEVKAVRARCDGVEREARLLWTKVQNGSTTDGSVEERWNDLRRTLDEATGSLDLPEVEDLNIKAAEGAKTVLMQDYHAAPT